MKHRTGQLLIAHPKLPPQTPFHKSVVYIFNDDDQGTQGFIINKPTRFPVGEFFKQHGFDLGVTKERMRYGGPVNTKSIFMLHTEDFESASSMPAGKGLMASCDDFMIEKMAMGHQPSLWRIMIGMAAWQPGQLGLELGGEPPYLPEHSWLTAEANESIIFEHDGEKQWKKALDLSSYQMINSYF